MSSAPECIGIAYPTLSVLLLQNLAVLQEWVCQYPMRDVDVIDVSYDTCTHTGFKNAF